MWKESIMLDIKKIRENPEFYQQEVPKKGVVADIPGLLALDESRRAQLGQVEELKAQRNAASRSIGELKKKGEDASEAMAATKKIGEEIASLDKLVKETEAEIKEILLNLPNVPHATCPEGSTPEENVSVREWGSPRELTFEALDHKDLGEKLGIFDFERGAKISGSGFPIYRGEGAKLERALIQYFLDTLSDKFGFEEVIPPYLVNR